MMSPTCCSELDLGVQYVIALLIEDPTGEHIYNFLGLHSSGILSKSTHTRRNISSVPKIGTQVTISVYINMAAVFFRHLLEGDIT